MFILLCTFFLYNDILYKNRLRKIEWYGFKEIISWIILN